MSDYPWSSAEPMPRVAESPGVYLFRDVGGRVLYVGKARNLRSRLATYRSPGGDGRASVAFLDRDLRSVMSARGVAVELL